MKKSILIFSLLLLVCFFPINSFGGEGRYQSTRVSEKQIVVLDTDDGHFWIIRISPGMIVYGGKLTTKMKKGEPYLIRKREN